MFCCQYRRPGLPDSQHTEEKKIFFLGLVAPGSAVSANGPSPSHSVCSLGEMTRHESFYC